MQHAWIDLDISLTFSCVMQTHGHFNATIALHGHTIWLHSSVKKLGLVGLAYNSGTSRRGAILLPWANGVR
jgi:hypothetical protein